MHDSDKIFPGHFNLSLYVNQSREYLNICLGMYFISLTVIKYLTWSSSTRQHSA